MFFREAICIVKSKTILDVLGACERKTIARQLSILGPVAIIDLKVACCDQISDLCLSYVSRHDPTPSRESLTFRASGGLRSGRWPRLAQCLPPRTRGRFGCGSQRSGAPGRWIPPIWGSGAWHGKNR